MAFVIDTSSSMVNDISKVKDYIRRIVIEQQQARTGRAKYIVTTFADPCKYLTGFILVLSGPI